MRQPAAVTVWPALAEQATVWSRLRARFSRKPVVLHRGTYVAPAEVAERESVGSASPAA